MIARTGLVTVLALAVRPAFHYERPVELAPSPASETCVVLPAELLSHAAPYLQDLRVFGGDREMAYLARISTGDAGEVARLQTILNLGDRKSVV